MYLLPSVRALLGDTGGSEDSGEEDDEDQKLYEGPVPVRRTLELIGKNAKIRVHACLYEGRHVGF